MNRRGFVQTLLAGAATAAQRDRSIGSERTAFRTVLIDSGERPGPMEQKAANLLAARIRRASSVGVTERGEQGATGQRAGELRILLGIPARHSAIATVFQTRRIPQLT